MSSKCSEFFEDIFTLICDFVKFKVGNTQSNLLEFKRAVPNKLDCDVKLTDGTLSVPLAVVWHLVKKVYLSWFRSFKPISGFIYYNVFYPLKRLF